MKYRALSVVLLVLLFPALLFACFIEWMGWGE